MIIKKLWLKIELIVVSRDDYKQKRSWPTENRAHALLLVILHGKSISFGFVISTLLIKMNLKWNLKMN